MSNQGSSWSGTPDLQIGYNRERQLYVKRGNIWHYVPVRRLVVLKVMTVLPCTGHSLPLLTKIQTSWCVFVKADREVEIQALHISWLPCRISRQTYVSWCPSTRARLMTCHVLAIECWNFLHSKCNINFIACRKQNSCLYSVATSIESALEILLVLVMWYHITSILNKNLLPNISAYMELLS